MNRWQVRTGMKVLFGRANGEKTLGVVVKCNPSKAKIMTLEPRGQTAPGVHWSVPYSLIEAFDQTEVEAAQVTKTAVSYAVKRLIDEYGKQAVADALANV
jgi:hypothetical protein